MIVGRRSRSRSSRNVMNRCWVVSDAELTRHDWEDLAKILELTGGDLGNSERQETNFHSIIFHAILIFHEEIRDNHERMTRRVYVENVGMSTDQRDLRIAQCRCDL